LDIKEAIRTKRAVREFTGQPLDRSTINAILNAGRRSQSSKNSQPWQFIAIQESSTRLKLSQLGQYAGHLAGAALAVAVLTPDPNSRFQVLFDAGQAAAYMQLAAWDLGVGSCIASIYEPEQARLLLGFPDEWHLRIAISFGYPLDPIKLTQIPKKGGRKPIGEIVHWEKW
jgi:nitroreductase